MKKIFTLLVTLLLLTGSSWGQFVVIGTGTTTTNGSTIDPVDRFYNYTHCQIIYTAAELAAGGMTAGATITALGFSISESAVSLANYTISMGHTTQTIAQPYISALTTVRTPFTYAPVVQAAGSFDMIAFTTNFMWDGSSNIVVNTCTGSNSFTSPYGGLRYTASTSGTITYVRTDGSDNCNNTSLSSTTYRPNIRFNYTPPVPCSGTPNPGNTLSTSNPVCSGVSFTLTLQNATPGTGVTYQWQSSPNGTTWTNVGTSSSSYTTSQTTATYYRCQVTCSGNTGISTPLVVTMNPFYYCYCSSGASYPYDEEIWNVTVGTLNNSSDCSTLGPGPGSILNCYSNYYGYVTAPNLRRTTSPSFSIQVATCGGNYSSAVKIFIDYNQNGSFADAGEEVFVSPSSVSGPHYATGNFTIPGTALIGNTCMRVVNTETGTPSSITACGAYGYGETEDYAVNIFDVPGVTTNAASGIGGTTADLNGTVSANAAPTTLIFEWGTMSAPPFNNTYTFPTTIYGQNVYCSHNITGLQPNTTYYFRVIGTNAGGTTNGSVLSFTTAMVAPAVTTNDATTVGATFATLNGSATAFNASTTVTFEYGTTPGGPYPNTAPGIPATVTGNTPTTFYAAITGLTINTNYYFRAKGVNGAGTTYGAQKTFYTTCVTPPTPGAISGPAQVCKNGTGYVYSVTQVAYGFYYNWTFPTGFTITSYVHSNSVTVDVSNSAVSGTITVIAVSDCGAPSAPSTKAVTVNNLPVPTVTGPSPTCQYANTNYTTQAGMTNYQWTVIPDGTITPTSNPQTATANWPITGAKTVGVVYTNPTTGCTAAAPGTLPVNVIAAPVPTISGQNSLCVNTGYYYYTTEAGNSNYIWTISSGGTITYGQGTSQIEVTWNTPGAQSVTVTYTNASGCSALAPTVYNVTVAGLPGPAGSITGTSDVCYNSTGVSYSVAPITNTMYYVWTLPAGATFASGEGTNSITVNFTNASSGNITVYGNSLCGNGSTSPPFPVTITQLPGAAGTITGSSIVCEGDEDVAYSVPAITGATGYRWTVPDGALIVSGDYTPNITVDFAMGASSGAITVYGTNFCGDGPISPDFDVTVNPKPEAPKITLDGDVLSSDAPEGNQWYYYGVPVPGETGQTMVAQYDGWYWDVVTVNGCESDTSNNIYVIITGIGEGINSTFVVYPVPNDGRFRVTFTTLSEAMLTLDVYNYLGVRIYNSRIQPVQGRIEQIIDLRPVPNGVYTVVLRTEDNRV
ncbi:MAG: hypothetical protein D4R67_02225, partial [Bacteroidetes bacterium]